MRRFGRPLKLNNLINHSFVSLSTKEINVMDNFTVKTTITAQQIDNIMADALDSGISYWCNQVKVKGDYLGEYASDQISRGGVLKLQDEDGKWHILTKAKFLKGVSLHKNHDFDDYDSTDADCIVQLAIFGEVVYG